VVFHQFLTKNEINNHGDFQKLNVKIMIDSGNTRQQVLMS